MIIIYLVYLVLGTIPLFSLIFNRYNFARKTANNQSLEGKKVVCLIASIYLFEHFYTLLSNALSHHYKWKAFTVACMGEDHESSFRVMPLIQVILIVISMIFGIKNDVLLYKFLKKRKKSVGPGHVRLMSWKSSRDDYKIYVPVHATILSILMIMPCNFVIQVIFFGEIGFYLSKFLLLYFNISIPLPMILLLSIR